MTSSPRSSSLLHKLAFTGYRVFLLQDPNWDLCLPGSIGILTYHEFNKDSIKPAVTELGYFPSPEEMAKFLCNYMNHHENFGKKYKPAFVNNERYELLWTDPKYAKKRAKYKNGGTPKLFSGQTG